MTTVVVVRINCGVCTTGRRQPHATHPYSPLQPQRWLLGSCCRLQKVCWTSTDDKQQQKKKSIYWLSVEWRRLCCLVRVIGLWRERKSPKRSSIKSYIKYSILFMRVRAQWSLSNKSKDNKRKIDFILTRGSICTSL